MRIDPARFRGGRSAERALHLVEDPAVGLLETVEQRDRGLPAVGLEDLGVVAVASAHALGRIELVLALAADARDALDDVDQAVDRDQFRAAQVDRLRAVAPEDQLAAL